MSAPEEGGNLTEREREIKAQFEEDVGYWTELYDVPLQMNPEFFDRFRKLIAHPYKNGHLDPVTRELMMVAVNSAPHHLYSEGIRIHIRNAFEHGATFEEIVEVLQRTSGQGLHAVTDGVPILIEEAGLPEETNEGVKREQDRVREKFEDGRGYWSDFWESVLQMDHEFLERYTDLSSYPFEHGPLDPKVKEFVAIANDASTMHLYLKGLRTHIQNALEYGATPAEIMEIFELVSALGVQTEVEAAPILLEEARKLDELPEDWDQRE